MVCDDAPRGRPPASEPYTVKWSKPAKRAISVELPEAAAAAALELILGALRTDPYRVGKPLIAPMEGVWSARRASYRILYRIDEDRRIVTIETIRHRRNAYR